MEQLLKGRGYTVFNGHVHSYLKTTRAGQNYYRLATTGGSSGLSGIPSGQFDHVVWVTMTDNGPIIANLALDGIAGDNPPKEAKDSEEKNLDSSSQIR